MDKDDDTQVYKEDGNALLIAYQSGYYAWLALDEIRLLLRTNEKHDVGADVTLKHISNEIINVFSSRGDL